MTNVITKTVSLSDFKSFNQGEDGGFKGYPSITGNLDDVGDIIPVGAYSNLAELAGRGWVCGDHAWGIEKEIGLILSAIEDAKGLLIEAEFHSDPESQAIRQKVQKRLERGKKVFMSIGFRLTQDPILIYPSQYDRELPRYLKPEHLREGLAKAKRFSYVRVLPRIEVYEASIVSVPANSAASVVSAKAKGETGKTALPSWAVAMREARAALASHRVKCLNNELTEADDRELLAYLYGAEALVWQIHAALKKSPLEQDRERKKTNEQRRVKLEQKLSQLNELQKQQ